jgi:hypothetical protein
MAASIVADPEAIAEQVRGLTALDLEPLRALWRSRWGPPPALRSQDLMARAVADRLQTEAHGGLSPALKRSLSDYARQFSADPGHRPTPGPTLTPGCSLVREWGGARHQVKVLDGGFAYQGKIFKSLTAVATHITGVKRSGVAFFGLTGAGAT